MKLARTLLDILLTAVTRYIENPANPPERPWTDGNP